MKKKRLISALLALWLGMSLLPIKAEAAMTMDEIVEATLQILYTHEGSYGSVAANDNGALSIGKVQWHGTRALNLLKTIVSMDEPGARAILGDALCSEIQSATDWNKRTLTQAEAAAVSKLLVSDNGIAAQDALAENDIRSYVVHGVNLGMNHGAALIYFADLENQCGSGGAERIAKQASATAGSYGAITLAVLHEAALNDEIAGRYASRRNAAYEYCLQFDDAPMEPETCECSADYAGEYICTTVSTSLMIRGGHGTFYGVVGRIPPGATVTVTAASGTGKDDWAHVVYDGVSGYASMQYLRPVSGEEDAYIVEWKSANATLTGSIFLNFSVVLSDNIVNDPTAFVRFTCADKIVEIPVSEAVTSESDGVIRYRFPCQVYAKQMTDIVTAQVMTANGPVGEPKSYSVAQYCNALMKQTTNPELIATCKAMLNYGAAAQTNFNYRMDDLANAGLSDADKIIATPDYSVYKHAIVGSEDGIKAASAKLVLDEDVAIRVTFQLTGNKTIDQYTFTIDGVVVQPVESSGRYYIELDGIAASKLNEFHAFSVGGLTVKYSALSYGNMIRNDDSFSNEMKLLMDAMYEYHTATAEYVN